MRASKDTILDTWLREAKTLHRQAKSDSLSCSLPVLRRLLNTNVLIGLTLPELKKDTTIVQRKHLLQMLAVESGHKSWADFKHALENMFESDQMQLPYSLELKQAGYPTLWFSQSSEAHAYASENGGKVVIVGKQAVCIPDVFEG